MRNSESVDARDSFDAIIIGTGFGGSVAACRLVQAGKKTCVLERGRRYESQSPAEYESGSSDESGAKKGPQWSDFPSLPGRNSVLPDPRRWVWSQDQGLWDVRSLGDIVTAQAAGYGGGSLVYANVHLRAPEECFKRWPFTRDELDPYYDLAAFMFDIKPITEAGYDDTTLLEKTRELKKAATALKREEDFFYPPLAINFDERENLFNRLQGACDGCGECCTGCRSRAKNSLDLNYLARVDDNKLASVLTQAEATRIVATDQGYNVEYKDHLRGGELGEVSAPSVFVCAGAVNTTDLLLRSRDEGGLPGLREKKALGTRYFPNADAIGMVYDAITPATAEKPGRPRQLSPTKGPTITAAIHYQYDQAGEDAKKPRWFLLEEGGFPSELARHIGLLRSPALLRRNRYDDRERCGIERVEGNPSSPSPAVAQECETEPLRSLAAGFYRLLRDEPEIIKNVSPKQLQNAFEQLEEELNPFVERHIHSFIPEVRRQLLRGILKPLRRITWQAPNRWIAGATKRALLLKYGLGPGADPKVRLEIASQVVKWLCRFDDTQGCHSQNSMVLLVMGRDTKPGRITLEDGDPLVDLGTAERPIYTRQINLMRDVACALGGKLRVSPLWSFARAPMTVHSQGGCPMSENSEGGVTDQWGQVHGYPGLFVMDAAAFPASVGVNPSATIAAVAERNMAHFLGKSPETGRFEPWMAPETGKVKEWKEKQGWMDGGLEPPKNTRPKPTKNKPVGIEWNEKMSGFYIAELKEEHTPPAMLPPADDTDYEAAEAEGREESNAVSIDLIATVEDVATVIRSESPTVMMNGTATVTRKGSAKFEDLPIKGTLTLPPLPGTDPRAPRGNRKMVLKVESAGVELVLKGYKRLRDDPGPDAWRDTSTLFLTLEMKNEEPGYGVIRLSLDEFIFEQSPSFKATNTEDPARIAWALTSFGAYFSTVLQGVYVPQLEKLIEQFTRLEIR